MAEITESGVKDQIEETLPGIEVEVTIEKGALDIVTEKVYPPLELKPGKSPPGGSWSVEEVEEAKDDFGDMYLDAFTKESLEEAGVKVPSRLEKRAESLLEEIYGEEFRITAEETDSEIEITMTVRPEHEDKYERGEVEFSAVSVGRKWEDVAEDLTDFAEMDVKDATKVGYLWDIVTIARKSPKFGADEAARVMKARCEAGAIVGCAMYTRLVKDWIDRALSVRDWAAFSPYIDGFRYCDEDDLADSLEDRFEDMPEDMPDDREIKEWQDDFEELMEERVGRSIPYSPEDTTRSEREKSKKIAIEVGKAKSKSSRIKSSGGSSRSSTPKKKESSESREIRSSERDKIKEKMRERMR